MARRRARGAPEGACDEYPAGSATAHGQARHARRGYKRRCRTIAAAAGTAGSSRGEREVHTTGSVLSSAQVDPRVCYNVWAERLTVRMRARGRVVGAEAVRRLKL